MMYKRSYKFKDNITVSVFLNKTKAIIRSWTDPYDFVTVWTKGKLTKTKWDNIAKALKGQGIDKWSECDKKG